MRADHGYNMESRAIRDLIQIMSSYDPTSRREFLQFITGVYIVEQFSGAVQLRLTGILDFIAFHRRPQATNWRVSRASSTSDSSS